MVAFGAWLKVLTIPDAGFFMRFQAVALPTQVMIALVVLYRLSSECLPAELGRNVTGILFGIALIVGVQAINFTSYLFFGQPYQLFGFVLQFGFFLALAVFCVSLWEYRPVRRLEPATQGQIADVDEKFQRVVKTLLLNK
jgi:hypothetical protein